MGLNTYSGVLFERFLLLVFATWGLDKQFWGGFQSFFYDFFLGTGDTTILLFMIALSKIVRVDISRESPPTVDK